MERGRAGEWGRGWEQLSLVARRAARQLSRCEADADDACQELGLRLWLRDQKGAHSDRLALRCPERFVARAARRVALDRLRAEAIRERTHAQAAEREGAVPAAAEACLMLIQLRALLTATERADLSAWLAPDGGLGATAATESRVRRLRARLRATLQGGPC